MSKVPLQSIYRDYAKPGYFILSMQISVMNIVSELNADDRGKESTYRAAKAVVVVGGIMVRGMGTGNSNHAES
jgi:hypothetical protein